MQLELYAKKIFLYRAPVDFRKSIDGLSSIVSNQIKGDLKNGIYLFVNRNKDKIKCLFWHKNGFALIYKRLEQGHFSMEQNHKTGAVEMQSDEFTWLLAGLQWHKMKQWQELSYDKIN